MARCWLFLKRMRGLNLSFTFCIWNLMLITLNKKFKWPLLLPVNKAIITLKYQNKPIWQRVIERNVMWGQTNYVVPSWIKRTHQWAPEHPKAWRSMKADFGERHKYSLPGKEQLSTTVGQIKNTFQEFCISVSKLIIKEAVPKVNTQDVNQW